MYIKKIHILIDEGLQQNGVFAYGGYLKEQVDLQIDKACYELLEERFKPLKGKTFQQSQGVLDEFQELQVKGLQLTPIKESEAYVATLPDDYIHLISDKTIVLWLCNSTKILTSQIEVDSYYVVMGTATITYNSIPYSKGEVFKGVTGVSVFTSGAGTSIVNKLSTRYSSNRLTKEEALASVLDNALETTSITSPVSSLSGKKLYVYYKDFFVSYILISYIRKPEPVNYNFTTFASGSLVNGTKYEVVKGTIVYNATTYSAFDTFTANATATFTGTGTVRKAFDGDLELSDQMCYKIINRVIEVLAVISEQNQQKIVNLAQQNNVSS